MSYLRWCSPQCRSQTRWRRRWARHHCKRQCCRGHRINARAGDHQPSHLVSAIAGAVIRHQGKGGRAQSRNLRQSSPAALQHSPTLRAWTADGTDAQVAWRKQRPADGDGRAVVVNRATIGPDIDPIDVRARKEAAAQIVWHRRLEGAPIEIQQGGRIGIGGSHIAHGQGAVSQQNSRRSTCLPCWRWQG